MAFSELSSGCADASEDGGTPDPAGFHPVRLASWYRGYREATMAVRLKRVTVWLPDETVAALHGAAAARGVSRSRFVVNALRAAAWTRSDEGIALRVDRLMADPRLAKEQRCTARAFQRGGSRRGTEW